MERGSKEHEEYKRKYEKNENGGKTIRRSIRGSLITHTDFIAWIIYPMPKKMKKSNSTKA